MDFIEKKKKKNNYGIYGIVNILNGNIYMLDTRVNLSKEGIGITVGN